MIKLIVAAIILIIVMLVFVFILFKNIIKRIDENAKTFFVNKLHSFDYILEEKQTKLEEIKSEIEGIKLENRNILKNDDDIADDYDGRKKIDSKKTYELDEEEEEELLRIRKQKQNNTLKDPDYRDNRFFNNYKELKRLFTVDNEQIVRDFIAKNKNVKEDKEYKVLQNIKDKFDEDAIYGCLTLNSDIQKKLIGEVLTKKEKTILNYEELISKKDFTVNDLIDYIEERMEQIEPTIYIYVNGLTTNYNYIDKNIITKQYSNMSEGIIIKYRNKIYDYSI